MDWVLVLWVWVFFPSSLSDFICISTTISDCNSAGICSSHHNIFPTCFLYLFLRPVWFLWLSYTTHQINSIRENQVGKTRVFLNTCFTAQSHSSESSMDHRASEGSEVRAVQEEFVSLRPQTQRTYSVRRETGYWCGSWVRWHTEWPW